MSTIVYCPLCCTVLVSHASHGEVPQHTYPGTTNLCPGVGQVGLTGVS